MGDRTCVRVVVALAVGLVMLLSLACNGVAREAPQATQTPVPTPTIECVTGGLIIPDPRAEGAFVTIGEVQVCGSDLTFSPLTGPSFEAHITGLEESLESCRATPPPGLGRAK